MNESTGSRYWYGEYERKMIARWERSEQKRKERFFGKRKDSHTYGKIKR